MILQKVVGNLKNIPGWHTNRKLVVFESDDWGSIRTRSSKDLQFLREHGVRVDNCHYMMNDGLASEEDLSNLIEILTSFHDQRGKKPVITLNCLVANPNFDLIKKSSYNEYFYESISETLKKYPHHANSLDLWKQGINLAVFHPQSHGREHLNISRWMRDLQKKNSETKLAFDIEMCSISAHIVNQNRASYLAAFDGGDFEIQFDRSKIIEEALKIFEKNFGYRSESFIAPNYTWDDTIEFALKKNDVKFIQGSSTQQISMDFGKNRQTKRHYLGQRNINDQIYLLRNCTFEPSEKPDKDWVNSCLNDINMAFRWGKPAVISTHRVNFIGFINKKNSDTNLPLFKNLLHKMIEKWPDIEFITSDQLGNLIMNNE